MAEVGRPTGYDKDRHPDWVRILARLGMTNLQMAEEMGISEQSFYNWQKEHVEFFEALTEGKSESDAKVVSALFKRAMGFSYTEREVVRNGEKVVKQKATEKFIPPDIGAIKLWLCNRDPSRWADRNQTELSGPNGAPVQINLIRSDFKQKSDE